MDLLLPPDIFQEEKIRSQLREDGDRMLNSIKLLKEWVTSNNYLPQQYDDVLLTTFLRGCKHDLEKTKKKLQAYFLTYCTDQEFLGNRASTLRDDVDATKFISTGMLPKLTPDGYRIIVIRVTDPDVNNFDLLKMYRYLSRIADIKIREDTFIAGEIFVIDAMLVNAEILAKFLSNVTRRAIGLSLEVYPVRIRAVHIICSIPFIENILNVLKSVIKDKLMKRFHFHKSFDKLSESVPLKCLPTDYGGPQKTLTEINEDWKGKVLGFQEKYAKLAEMKLNGPIPREVKRTNFDAEYGMQGSFRKLNLD